MISWHGLLMFELQKFWFNLRTFAFRNKTIFEMLFLSIYLFEQVLLVGFTFYWGNNSKMLSLTVSVFALIVLTTFSLHKMVMESRISILEDQINELIFEKLKLISKNNEIAKKHAQLADNLLSHLEKKK